jgi:hypothetical protein
MGDPGQIAQRLTVAFGKLVHKDEDGCFESHVCSFCDVIETSWNSFRLWHLRTFESIMTFSRRWSCRLNNCFTAGIQLLRQHRSFQVLLTSAVASVPSLSTTYSKQNSVFLVILLSAFRLRILLHAFYEDLLIKTKIYADKHSKLSYYLCSQITHRFPELVNFLFAASLHVEWLNREEDLVRFSWVWVSSRYTTIATGIDRFQISDIAHLFRCY